MKTNELKTSASSDSDSDPDVLYTQSSVAPEHELRAVGREVRIRVVWYALRNWYGPRKQVRTQRGLAVCARGKTVDVSQHVEDDLSGLRVHVQSQPCPLGHVIFEESGKGEVG